MEMKDRLKIICPKTDQCFWLILREVKDRYIEQAKSDFEEQLKTGAPESCHVWLLWVLLQSYIDQAFFDVVNSDSLRR
jgi:hypothetical protein